ncbi:hypothetical protein B0G80_5358 [Paraburkholderia sp. BL6669N2]|uniref:tetratricopeptide repeat protein n=1 Tax=Paraburkholderia sp. BL6669N2 TaxID=1938807 RepID=UPI000E274872|nr:ATP-binding protein [Paraburkholderia sp. BL6669N2]REG49035.1 hypothetical protein B0G80_5358 [Paraburkholderia sp. BL6669N2]
MTEPTVRATISGGTQTGIIGAATVTAGQIIMYNYPPPVAEPAAVAEAIDPCPYPGLAYFGPDDADRFFGRNEAIGKLVTAVGRQSLTALVGASGSGKSSVVLAGLAPRLHLAGGWLFSYFRIGNELDGDPFLALARALVPFYVASSDETERLVDTRKLAQKLRSGELTLRDVFAACRTRNKGSRILLIADQFEEAFTLVPDDAIRNQFIDVLLAGFLDRGSGAPDISLVLTLRADFYGRALLNRPLADALQDRVENLGPMSREELRLAIEKPAENATVSFEPGLIETLLDDVESKPGSLPLLQFALREMWGRQTQRKITRKSYDDIGGVERAVAQRAETIYGAMTENGANPQMAQAFQRLFTRLVAPGEGQEDTRRIADRRELGDDVWALAQHLAGEDNRLVVTNAPAFARETAEVVHEALIRHWPKLVDWINRDRAFHSWLRQIKSNVELWSTDPSDDGPLLRGGMLAQARDWLARRRDDLSTAEKCYIEASLALQEQVEGERETARQAEIGRQRELTEAADKVANEQRRRARAWKVGGLAAFVLAAVAVFTGYEAFMAKKRADLAAIQALQERDLASFTADTTKRVSGATFAKAAELASIMQKAVASNSASDRAEAFDQFALYYNDAGDWQLGRLARREAEGLLRGSSDRVAVARHHEVSGDLQWGDPASALSQYGAALTLLQGSGDFATERARVMRKMALALINQGKLDEAVKKVDQANSIIKDKVPSSERAFLLSVLGQIELARQNDLVAIGYFQQAADRFADVLGATHRDLLAGLRLGQTLQMMGDAERRKGLAHAYDSYDGAIQSLEPVLADDPALLDALRSTELARRGLRLMSMTSRNDAARVASFDRAKSDFEANFGDGIGKFRYGMTTAAVNLLLKPPFDQTTLSNLDRAWEYRTSDVRYLCRWFGGRPPDGVGCGAGIPAEDLTLLLFPNGPACMLNNGYAVFMFADNTLFRIVVRFSRSSDACPERLESIEEFARRFRITASGGYGTRRLRYETDKVGLVAFSDDDVVEFDFEQR